MTSIEAWREVPGFPGLEVSDHGNARRYGRRIGYRDGMGYVVVRFHWKTYRLHRLVAATFLGPIPPGNLVRHLNDVRHDNRPENLAYGTQVENMHDRSRNGHDHDLAKTRCKQGHPFGEANTKVVTKANGRQQRLCRTCRRAIEARSHAKKNRAAA